MIPARAIAFQPGQLPTEGITLFFSLEAEAVGALCMFASGALGLLWLSGSELGQTANLGGRGFFVPDCEIDVDTESLVLFGEPIPTLSVLQAGSSTAIRAETPRGATRIYTIAGPPFGEPDTFAAFSLWRAVLSGNADRHIVQVVGTPLVG
jgi:hypothetical protein